MLGYAMMSIRDDLKLSSGGSSLDGDVSAPGRTWEWSMEIHYRKLAPNA